MKNKNSKQNDISVLSSYMKVRQEWTRNPVTRIKGNNKKQAQKLACRGKVV